MVSSPLLSPKENASFLLSTSHCHYFVMEYNNANCVNHKISTVILCRMDIRLNGKFSVCGGGRGVDSIQFSVDCD